MLTNITETSVSILKVRDGENWRRAYINSEDGRVQLQKDFPAAYEELCGEGKPWGTEPTVFPEPEPTVDLAAEARAKRDKLLAETDWTQVLDAPISAECREAFRVYRQALRDITEQEGFPEVIEWPTMPEVVKAAPDPVDTAVDVLLGGEEA